MKPYKLIAAVSLLTLAGCSDLTTSDRQRLDETHILAQQAAQDARIARAEAAKASEKADRIWRRSQNK